MKTRPTGPTILPKAFALFLTLFALGCDRAGGRAPHDSARHSPNVAVEQDSVTSTIGTRVNRPRRFGLLLRDRSGPSCIRIEADSLAEGTDVALVSVTWDADSPQRISRARIVRRLPGPCSDSSSISEGETAYILRAAPGDTGEAIGIIGPIDTLHIELGHAVAVFPGDTAHWQFSGCSSHEGLHYQVGRRSGDSSVVIYDGYSHVNYDLEPTCHDERDFARAIEARARLADWNGGKRTHDTAMSLLIARFTRCMRANEDDSDVSASSSSDSAAYPALMPPMAALLRTIGAPNDLSAEDAFVLATLGDGDDYCFGPSLGTTSEQLRLEAARKDTSSLLFRYFQPPRDARRGSVNAVAAELHRRFDNRGEHYRLIRDRVRDRLSR
jgi:hypothetical protein